MSNLTKEERNNFRKKSRVVCMVLTILAFIHCFLNAHYLIEDPFSGDIEWDEPSFANIDGNGTMAVIDSNGTRIVCFSEDDGEINGILGLDALSKVRPNYATALVFGNDMLYVLDHSLSENGTEITNDRILAYNYSGDYIEQIYETPEDSNERICNIYFKDGKIITAGTSSDENKNYVTVSEVENGELKHISNTFVFDMDIFRVTTNPNTGTVWAVAHKGLILEINGSDCKEIDITDLGINPSDAVSTTNGIVYIADSSKNQVWQYDENGKSSVVAELYGNRLIEKDGKLYCADAIKNCIRIIELKNGNETVVTSAKYPTSYKVKIVITFLCLGMFILGIVAQVMHFLIRYLKSARTKSNLKEIGIDEDKFTIRQQILKYSPAFVLSFLTGAILFSSIYWESKTESCRENINNVALSIVSLSTEGLGNDLESIKSCADYDSVSYNRMINVLSALCDKSYFSGTGFDYAYSVYKFMDNENDVVFIRDKFNVERIGTVLTEEEQEKLLMKESFDAAREGRARNYKFEYNNGTKMMCVSFPIANTDYDIIGMGELCVNYSNICRETLKTIGKALIQFLTILSGFLILLPEINLYRELVNRQVSIIKEGNRDNTLVESKHTLQIIVRILMSMTTVFITLIAKDIMDDSGITDAVLLALPFTIYNIVKETMGVGIHALSTKDLNKTQNWGCIIQILGAVICIYAVISSGYVALCIGTAFLAAGGMTCREKLDELKELGNKTTDRYNDLESASLIAPPIASAFGAIVRSYFGNTAIFIVLIVLVGLFYVSKNFFIGNSILSEEKIMKRRIKNSWKDTLSYCLKPRGLAWIVFMVIPIAVVPLFEDYVTPMVTKALDYSDIAIGTIGIVILFATIFILPYWNRLFEKREINRQIAIGYVIIGVLLLLFSRIKTIQAFTIAAVAMSMTDQTLENKAMIVIRDDIKRYNLKNVNEKFLLKMWKSIFTYIAPVIITISLINNEAGIGGSFGFFSLICAAVSLVAFKPAKES